MTGIVVIGVGDPYRRDDGVGHAVVDLLRQHRLPLNVRLECSLGDSTELLDLWTHADLAILVDAARPMTRRPGAVHHTVSSHALPMGEAVELARALGRLPQRLELYAIEVADTGHGKGLSPAARSSALRVAQTIATEVKRACAWPIQRVSYR